MNPGQLYEAPFTGYHQEGAKELFGDDDVDNLIAIVNAFNTSVEADFGKGTASA